MTLGKQDVIIRVVFCNAANKRKEGALPSTHTLNSGREQLYLNALSGLGNTVGSACKPTGHFSKNNQVVASLGHVHSPQHEAGSVAIESNSSRAQKTEEMDARLPLEAAAGRDIGKRFDLR